MARWLLVAALSVAALTVAQKTDSSKYFYDVKTLSAAEKTLHAKEAVDAIEGVYNVVYTKLSEPSNDAVKLSCLQEKFNQIKGLSKISTDSKRNLESALLKNSTETADAEFTKITIARAKAEQLRAEAEQCLGGFTTDQNMIIELDVPDYLPVTDPSITPFVQLFDPTKYTTVVRPVPASPTM